MGPADEHHPPDDGAPPARAEPGLAGRARYPLCFLVVRLRRPLVDQAAGSFFNWYDIHPASFAGFHYYGEVLADPMASAALVHTAIYVGVAVPVEVVLGVAGAWLVYRARRGRAALTTLFMLPLVVPWAATATLFSVLLRSTSGDPARPGCDGTGRDSRTWCHLVDDRAAAARVPRLAAPLLPRHHTRASPVAFSSPLTTPTPNRLGAGPTRPATCRPHA